MGNAIPKAACAGISGVACRDAETRALDVLLPTREAGQSVLFAISDELTVARGDVCALLSERGRRVCSNHGVVLDVMPATDTQPEPQLNVCWLYHADELPADVKRHLPTTSEFRNALFLSPETTDIVPVAAVEDVVLTEFHALYDRDFHEFCVKGVFLPSKNALVPFPVTCLKGMAKQLCMSRLQLLTTAQQAGRLKHLQREVMSQFQQNIANKKEADIKKLAYRLRVDLLDILSLGPKLCSLVQRDGDELYLFFDQGKSFEKLTGKKQHNWEFPHRCV